MARLSPIYGSIIFSSVLILTVLFWPTAQTKNVAGAVTADLAVDTNEIAVAGGTPASKQFAVEGLPEGVTVTFDPPGCAPGLTHCTVQMILDVAADASPTPIPAVVTITGTSPVCGSRSRKFLVQVVAKKPSVDLKLNGEDGPVKFFRNSDGSLSATVHDAGKKGIDALLTWELNKTTGQVSCFLSRSSGDLDSSIGGENSMVVHITGNEIFRIQCDDEGNLFSDSVEVEVLGATPKFEEF